MTKRGGADVAFFLCGGRNLVGTLTEFTDTLEARTERSDCLGDNWEKHAFVGVRAGEIQQSGFYDDGVGSAHEALSTAGSTNILCYCLEGTATGRQFVGWSAGVELSYQRIAARDQLTKAKASYRTAGAIETGKVVRPWNVWAATGNTTATPIDHGACSTGGAGYLQHQAASGEANVRLIHSPDAAAWADLVVFTKLSSGYGAQRSAISGVIQRYVAADYPTATATGKVGALTAMLGLVRTATA